MIDAEVGIGFILGFSVAMTLVLLVIWHSPPWPK